MGAPTESGLDLDEQISQLMQCKPLSEQQAKWLNKQLSKLWPFIAEVHTLAFCFGVLDSLAVELKALKDFSKLYAITVMDARGLSGGERLLWCSKSDAPFKAMTFFFIKQAINNYNCCRADPSLTFTVPEHPLST
ncbi:hypothetical protein PVK06_008077 [Gossypium arboreum]|uniref:Uncharacterized protein n=1 Tax=Gossypium arboreum TaxID=29729 RepID=A0ABR0QJS1_GOSAR|nr:hypothetical protein PVK06_008077 [Gossypium arboreum]